MQPANELVKTLAANFTLDEDVTVQYFSPQTASAITHLIHLDREDLSKLEADLARRAGVSPENHAVYGVTASNRRTTLYVQFSDRKVYIGLAVSERRWQ